MTTDEQNQLIAIMTRPEKPWERLTDALKYVRECGVDEKEPEKRSQSQHNSLFLWFSMIEHEAENQGVTWDMIIRHTHQLRVTKENLHSMCKDLQKALWKTTSTKELKKTGNIDIIIDHFVDLLSKEMEFIPEFPHDKDKENQRLKSFEVASKLTYPEDIYNGEEPTI